MTTQQLEFEMVTMYSKNKCPNCLESIRILTAKKIKHTVVKVDGNDEAHRFLIAQGHKSVPQFYDGNTYLGDYYSFIKKFK